MLLSAKPFELDCSKILLFGKELKIVCESQQRSAIDLNSLPHNKTLDWSKLKTFASNRINVNEKLKFGMGRIENIVGKRKKWYPSFSPLPTMFSKA